MPLTFFYPEYEGQKTSPQAYVKEVVRRQQALNELCTRRMYDEKILQAKACTVGQGFWAFQNVISQKTKK